MKRLLLAFLIVMLSTTVTFSQSTTVFSGVPTIKISEGGIERSPEKLERKDAPNLKCVISKIGEKYYWATRENKEMFRIESGAFTTFFAVDGSGYVRIVQPAMKESASLMAETEAKFDYVEHMLIGLRSVTYYGVRSQ
jgi:hypothetical protein